MTSQRRHLGGFTLIELVVAIVIVSVGAVGLLSVYNTYVKYSADPMVRKQTVAIAESLLEEILLKGYSDPDGAPNVEANRALWDDVSDYAGYTTAGGMVDVTGTAIAGLGPYNVTNVAVAPLALNGVNLLQVTVTVTGPDGPLALTGWRAPP